MNQLGGIAINLTRGDTQLSRGEPIEDVAPGDLADGRRRDDPHFRADDHRALRRPFARAGDQRPHQRAPSLPDPGRHLHLHRASRRHRGQAPWPGSATPTTCCNTWLQAADVLRLQRPRLDAAGLRGRAGTRRLAGTGHCETFADPMEAAAAPTSSPPTSGPAWASRPRTPSACRVRRLAGRRRHDAAGEARRALHALPARAPRRGSRRRGDRRPAERGLGRGGEPPARAEGAARIPRLWPHTG